MTPFRSYCDARPGDPEPRGAVLPPTKAPFYQAHNALRSRRQATIKLIQERLGAS
jgi:hypothetical protein